MAPTRERLGTAQHTDDLSERPGDEIGDLDIVRASGLAGARDPLGLSIWRWRVGGDQRELLPVARGLVAKGWDATLVARVLTHLSNDRCGHCEGRGYKLLPDVPVLSDELCTHCQGTGRAPLTGGQERELAEVIAGHERSIAGAIMRRLSKGMEF